MVIIENLPIGKYYVLEKETASEDYILNTEKIYFEILENESVAKIEMINEIVIKVPNTEKNELPLFEIGALLVSFIGLGVIIYVKRKK